MKIQDKCYICKKIIVKSNSMEWQWAGNGYIHTRCVKPFPEIQERSRKALREYRERKRIERYERDMYKVLDRISC